MRICAGQTGQPYAGLKVYAFDGPTYTGYNGTSDEDGQVTFTLPQGSYRFRADYDGVQFWSGTTNHCDIPGCSNAEITLPGSLVGTNVTIDYAYDGLYRLIQAYYARTGSPGDYQSGYDYEYDRVGNRIYEDAWSEYSETERFYTYDDANRLTGVDETATTYEDLSWEHILSQVENSHSYTWDANGSLLYDGESYYQYDLANRLISVSNQSTVSSYQYNGLGDRISQTVNSQTTTYTLDLNTGLTQVLADGTYTYLYGNSRIAQSTISNPQSAIAYYLGDALGSVRQLTDAQASVTLSRSYAPYGEVTGSAGSGASAYGYTGEYTDPTGMVYLRARYYAPWQGRFVSRDTWGGDANSPMSYNMWLYGYANPINFNDPSGHTPHQVLYQQYSCDPKINLPTSPISQEVRIINHSGPIYSSDGAYDWKVKFELVNDAVADGWIVQEIEYQRQLYSEISDTWFTLVTYHFWEAWPVKEGKRKPSESFAFWSQWNDNYYSSGSTYNMGWVKVKGTVKFYVGGSKIMYVPQELREMPIPSGEEWGDAWVRYNPSTLADSLSSTTIQPEFWNTNGGTRHDFYIYWDNNNNYTWGYALWGTNFHIWMDTTEIKPRNLD